MSDELATRVGTILNGTASGLIPMAVFTPVYAIWPVFAWTIPGIVFFLAAAAGLVLSAQATLSWQSLWAIVGAGAALVTSSYGLWIRLTARRVLNDYRVLPEPTR